MEVKPLLALMAMCTNPYPYVGKFLPDDFRSYMKRVNGAIRQYLDPQGDSQGKGGATIEAFLERRGC